MKIFVSYRRADSRHVVVPMCDLLSDAFGHWAVFRDEEVIAPGSGFMGSIGGGIYTADIILVVVGPTWLTVTDERGRRRLDDKEDAVRMEVGLALASRRPTVPLLVDSAEMPPKRSLPRDIRNFASLSAHTIDGGDGFDASVRRLIDLLGGPRQDATTPAAASRRPRRNAPWSSFEGLWQATDGSMYEVVQDGQHLEINGRSPVGVELHGAGTVSGQQAVLDCSNSIGGRGRLAMQLTPEGQYINAQWNDGRTSIPIQMMRRG